MSEVVLGCDPTTGEVKGTYVVSEARKVRPKAPFRSWFSVNQATITIMAQCKSVTDIRVFFCLANRIENGNFICVNQSEVAKELGIRQQHVSTAIKHLMGADILRRAVMDGSKGFVINESLVWKGPVETYTPAERPIGRTSKYYPNSDGQEQAA